MPQAGSSDRTQNSDLQVLRAVAALLVLVDHAMLAVGDALGITRVYVGWSGLAACLGTMGVAGFFVLSGYIMLETNKRGFANRKAALNFLARRYLRIAPTYYVGTACVIPMLIWLARKSFSFNDLLCSLAFVPHYAVIENAGFFPVLGVGWTLNMEMAFYVLFAICLSLSPRNGVLTLAAVIAASVGVGHVLEARGIIGQQSVLVFYAKSTMLLFAAGVLLSWYEQPMKAALGRLPVVPSFHVMLAGLIFLAGAFAFSGRQGETYIKAIELTSFFLVLPAVYHGIALSGQLRKVFVYLGDASYSLYVFHATLLAVVDRFWVRMHLPSPTTEFLLSIAIALAGSLAAYHLIEQSLRKHLEYPLRRLLDKRLGHGSKP